MEGVQTPSIQRVGDIVDGYLRLDNNSNIEGVQTPSIQRVIWDVMGCGLPNYLCGGRMWAPKLSLGWLKICLGFIIPTMIFFVTTTCFHVTVTRFSPSIDLQFGETKKYYFM